MPEQKMVAVDQEKTPPVEANSASPTAKDNYEFCTLSASDTLLRSIFGCGITNYFTKQDIDNVIQDPIANNETARKIANLIYRKSGIVSSVIDYMVAMPTLQNIITYASNKPNKTDVNNKQLFLSVLKRINHKSFIRDALFSVLNNGTIFYYFDTKVKSPDNRKFLTDLDVDGIVEINEAGINANITTLPIDYMKIVGKKNGRYVVAFNLEYFNDFTGEKLEAKLRRYPSEISDAYRKYQEYKTGGHWLKLDEKKTICCKIKCKDSDPWGLPFVLGALNDLLYSDDFLNMKRSAIDDQINNIFYQTLPADKDGRSLLTQEQQRGQHEAVKEAVMHKNNNGGTNFFSVAPGTKFDRIKVDSDIFDSKYESDLNDKISMDLGVAGTLIGSSTSTGNFSSTQNNLELINAYVYELIDSIASELNFVINENIIKDTKHKVETYYLPLSFVNKSEMVTSMKELYTLGGGSIRFWIAATGLDPDKYIGVLKEERESGIYDDTFMVHPTSYTTSGNDDGKDVTNVGGRPTEDKPTNENTIISKSNGGNKTPRVSK